MRTLLFAAVLVILASCEKKTEHKRADENKLCFMLNGVTWCNTLINVNESKQYVYAETYNDTAMFSFLLDKELKLRANICTMSTNSGKQYTSVADSFTYNYMYVNGEYIANFEGVMRSASGDRAEVRNGLMVWRN